MTQCERLIKEGLLPPSFLEAETSCDYYIDEKMKKLWAMQIDLVKKAEDLFKIYGLTLFMIGGSFIGAIRHKGCIPWDDDIDIALKRKDYNVFTEKAREERKEPCFLQSTETDPYFFRSIVFPGGVKRYFRQFNAKCKKLSERYKDRIGIQYTFFGSINRYTWDASWFDEAIDAPFEYTTLPIPKGYDNFLTAQYGDYMKFPPVEKRGDKHEFEIEPDVPYKQYRHEKYGVNYKN